jgi:hypothetical protein
LARAEHLLPLKSGYDVPYLEVRDIADGILPLSETTEDKKFDGGQINVEGVPNIGIYVTCEYGTGDISAVALYPQFRYGGAWAYATTQLINAGAITLYALYYALADGLTVLRCFILPNPGAQILRFRTNATGTDATGSSMRLRIVRFHFNPQILWEE